MMTLTFENLKILSSSNQASQKKGENYCRCSFTKLPKKF